MSSFCAVVLLSPILEEVFHLGKKSHGIAKSRDPEEARTDTPAGGSAEHHVTPSLGCEASLQVCPAGVEHILAWLTLLLFAVMAPTELTEASLHVTAGFYSLWLPAWMSLYSLCTPVKPLVQRRIE